MAEESAVLKSWESDYSELFQNFLKELSQWPDTGTEPQSGNQDIRYYLDLEEHRLKERGLSMKLDFKAYDYVASGSKVVKAVPILNVFEFARYGQSTDYQTVEKRVEYFRNGKSVYRNKKDLTAYLTIIEPKKGNENIGEETYSCPNCGAITKIHILEEEGCPYCRTKYLITDLFPKVTNYYFLDNAKVSEKIDKGMKRYVFAGIGVFYIMGLIFIVGSIGSPDFVETLIMTLIGVFIGGGMMGALGGYMTYSMTLLARTLFMAGKTMPVNLGSAGSRSKITRNVSKFDPTFSYEYFEGKALSLARIIILSSDLVNCVQYSGNETNKEFREIININYRGGMKIGPIERKGNVLEVKLQLYLTNTYDNGKKIKEKDEEIHLILHHNAEFKVVPDFSIKKVECPNCGGSFDATRYGKCPYCDCKYDVTRDDWTVKQIWK